MALLPEANCGLPRGRPSLPAQQLPGGRRDAFGHETELLLERLQGRGGPKGPHADGVAGAADVSLPAERGRLFDRQPRLHGGWQHAVPILLRLALEDLPRWHRDDARANALGEQLLVRLNGEAQLATRGDEDQLRISAGGIG